MSVFQALDHHKQLKMLDTHDLFSGLAFYFNCLLVHGVPYVVIE